LPTSSRGRDSAQNVDSREEKENSVNNKTKSGLLGFSVGLFAGIVVYKLLRKFGFAERPPIIIKNGSIDFITASGWDVDGDDYEQKATPRATKMIAWLTNSKNCSSLETRNMFKIEFADSSNTEGSVNFHVKLKQGGVRVGPKGQLRKSGNTLSHGTAGAGHITRISAPGGADCEFADHTGEIKITFE
jgi:hypothetical protein